MLTFEYRWLSVWPALVLIAACSSTPTGPSPVGAGPLIAHGPLSTLIPQGPPPVPPRLSATPPTALGANRFVAFGDSITSGTLSAYDGAFLYDVPSHSYSERLRLALNKHHAPQTFTVVNAGRPGEWAHDGARRIQSTITTNRPQALLLLEGVNDLSSGAGVSATVAALFRIVDVARQNNVTVLVATMPQTYDGKKPNGDPRDNAAELIVPFNTEIERLAASRLNVHVVDLYRAFGDRRSLLGGDGLHPTEEGYELMASTFMDVLEAVFPVRGSFQ
jgi:lysophospholipase L1-like esterase